MSYRKEHYDSGRHRRAGGGVSRKAKLLSLLSTVMAVVLVLSQFAISDKALAAYIGTDSSTGVKNFIQRYANGTTYTWNENILTAEGAWAYCCAVDEHFVAGDATKRDALEFFGGRQDVVTALAYADYAVWHNMYSVPGGDYNTTPQEKYAIAQVMMWQILNQYGYSNYEWFASRLSYDGARWLTGNEGDGCNYWTIIAQATNPDGDVQKYFRGHASVYDAGPYQDIIGQFSLDGAVVVEKGGDDPTVMYGNDGYDLAGAVIGAYTSDPRVAKNGTSAILTSKSDPVASWEMVENLNGTVMFKNKVTGNFLDAYGGTAAKYDSNPVVTWDGDGAIESRSWYKNDAGNGKFTFGNFVTPTQALCPVGDSGWTHGTKVWTWSNGGGNTFSWTIEDNGDGSVSLRHAGSGLYLGMGENATFASTDASGRAVIGNLPAGNVVLYEVEGPNAGYKIDAEAKQVTVSSLQMSPVLFTEEGVTGSIKLTKVDATTDASLPGAEFGIWTSSEAALAEQDVELGEFEGEFIIASDKAPHLVLDVANGSTDNSANVQVWVSNGTEAQRWKLEPYGTDGYYYVTNVKSGKVLDVYNGAVSDGSNVQQYGKNAGPGQLWKPVKVADGVYELVSSGGSGSVVLDLAGGTTLRGANADVYTRNGTAAQHWQFHRVNSSYVGSMTSDAGGKASLSGLPIGTYYVKETVFPNDYVVPDPVPVYEVNVTGEGSFSVNGGKVPNEQSAVPSIGTSLTGDDGKEIEVVAGSGGNITLTDTVSYSNLTPGTTYTLEGKLMDKSTSAQFVGIASSKTFTPSAANGTVDVVFNVPISALSGTTNLVAYEILHAGNSTSGSRVCSHENINDSGQTVKIKTNNPSIETSLAGSSGKTVIVNSNDSSFIVLTDTVSYSNLVAGTTYTLEGKLMDKSTSAQFANIASSKTFTPTSASGTVEVSFEIPLALVTRTTDLVAYEVLHLGGNVGGDRVCSHENISDIGQTVKLEYIQVEPTIATTLGDSNGRKELLAEGSITLTDTVACSDLSEDTGYKLVGTLYDTASNAVVAGPVEKTFTTEDSSTAEVKVTFTIDASQFAGKSIVACQVLYEDGESTPVARHEDKTDALQTVHFPQVSTAASDKATGEQVSYAQGNQIIVDALNYKNLTVNKTYTVKTKLVDSSTGTDISGATKTSTLAPASASGTENIELPVSASSLAGKTVTVYEEIYDGTVLVARHADKADTLQQISFPNISTVLTGPDGAKEILASGSVTLEDEVSYSNLVPNKEYTFEGKLVDSSGAALGSTVAKTFTPSSRNGTISMPFTVDAASMKGKKVIAYETLKIAGKMLAEHADLTDSNQTVVFPGGHTTATDKTTGTHFSLASGTRTIVDEVVYTGLIPSKQYEVSGTLMDKSSGEPLMIGGSPVTSSKTFTPTAADGSVLIEFTFNASALAGKTVVAFETVSSEGRDVFVHADIDDTPQTVFFPSVRTKALADNGTQSTQPGPDTKIADTVSYSNLIAGQSYRIEGSLVDAATSEPIEISGHAVTASKTFTASSASGTVDLLFEFDSTNIDVPSIVVFEKLYDESGSLIGMHEDSSDKNQTIDFIEIGTTALDGKTGTHEQLAEEESSVTDTVAYRNLVPGKEYTITGTLYDVETGLPLSDGNGGDVTSSKTFTPESANGTVDIVFTVPSSSLAGKTYVAFEDLYQDGKKIATHSDIEDKGQTIYVPKIGTTATDEANGLHERQAGEAFVVDVVSYSNLRPGREYELSGYLVKKSDGSKLPGSDATVTFTPTSENGTVSVKLPCDATQLVGETVVAFETVSYDRVPVAVHMDITDEGQAVKIVDIATTATSTDTGLKMLPAEESVSITDTVAYTNLTPGAQYTVNGSLVDKASPDTVLATATTQMTPNSPDGTADLEFSVSASELVGHDLVCFEELTNGNKMIAEHKDIDDEGQTVHVVGVRTTARDADSGTDDVLAHEDAKVIDTVAYTNLVPGIEYTLEGTIIDKETGEPWVADEQVQPITATKVFTPEAADGEVDVEFIFDANELAGETLVCFEVLSVDGKVLTRHEDIDDEGQEFGVPDVKTNATDGATGTDEQLASEKATIVDAVSYFALHPGKEYTVSGTIMVYDDDGGHPLLDAEGNEIKSEKTFTPAEANGSVELTFSFDSSLLAGETLVVFEDLYRDGKKIAVHADIDDVPQTVYIPKISTTATDAEIGEHVTFAGEKRTITDKVAYENLCPGRTYTMTGTLMDKETGKPLSGVNGTTVTASKEFTPEKPNGTVSLAFEIDASTLAGHSIVAFESCSHDGKEVAVHADIDDEGQTVHVPEIGTTASVADDPTQTDKIRIIDVVSYSNLPVGLEYEVSGSLMDKATRSVIASAGPVRFTPDSPNGTVEVEFVIDAKANMDKTLVAFEDVTYSGYLVGRHADYNDRAQTVEFNMEMIKTGDTSMPAGMIAICVAAIAGLAVARALNGRKRTVG